MVLARRNHVAASTRFYERGPNPWEKPIPLSMDTLPPIIAAVLVETLLYGIHLVLFIICSSVLFRRRDRGWMQTLMLGMIIVMFVLATTDVALSWRILLHKTKLLLEGDSKLITDRIYPKFLLHLFNNFMADLLLIHRCYIVWGRPRYLLYVAGILLVVGTVFGGISEGSTSTTLKKFIPVYIFVILGLNTLMTVLMAGRIWYIAREVRKAVGNSLTGQYDTAISIVIESGAIYTTSIILVLVLAPTHYILVAACIEIRIVCIMPILIIVQIALGRSSQSMEASLHQARSGHRSTVALDTMTSVLAFRSIQQTTTLGSLDERMEDRYGETNTEAVRRKDHEESAA